MQLRYPRFIHAEFMTHRMFSRNASSSRAIPVKRMIEDLRRDPAMPVHWGSNKPGMQAGADLDVTVWDTAVQQGLPGSPYDQREEFIGAVEERTGVTREDAWGHAMERAIQTAEAFHDAGYHKQIVNRILEPWAHINVVVTATDWENFFALRRHKDAQPEIKALAEAMFVQMALSIPGELEPGEWHLPYVGTNTTNDVHDHIYHNDINEIGGNYDLFLDEMIAEFSRRISVARCARVSYLTHDGRETTVEEDLKLYDRLVGSQPLHASPAEHQATPDTMYNNPHNDPTGPWSYENPELHGNFRGWIQYRKTLSGECVIES